MDDILFQLDLCWEMYLKYVSNVDDYDNDILYRLWSIQFYWKNVLNASFHVGDINEQCFFSNNIKQTLEDITMIHNQWIVCISKLSEDELHSTKLCKWPFNNRSFFSLALWVNLELMKYVSEIGMINEKTVDEPLL